MDRFCSLLRIHGTHLSSQPSLFSVSLYDAVGKRESERKEQHTASDLVVFAKSNIPVDSCMFLILNI